MSHGNDRPAIIEIESLSEGQLRDIRQLVDLCCRHDGIRLSYPTEGRESDGELCRGDDGSSDDGCGCDGSGRNKCSFPASDSPGPRHWLCYGADGMLQSVLALVYDQDSPVECSAFTHPDFRRRGLFSCLLERALASCEDCDILFTVSGRCADTDAALQALGAEPVSTEYQMDLELTDTVCSDLLPSCMLRKVCCEQDTGPGRFNRDSFDDTVWKLFCGEEAVGSCRTSMVSDACACLHHVEILPPFRRQGFGYALICRLLPLIYREGVKRVILQVSGDNTAALALYKKTGFRITETLSFYLY